MVITNEMDEYLREVLSRRVELAKELEPMITSFMENLAKKYCGELKGLKNRLKTFDSALRKASRELVISNKPVNDVVNTLSDLIRYTIVLDEDNFTDKINAIVKEIKEQEEYTITQLKNRFKNNNSYKDILTKIEKLTEGFVFEVQFHTPSSYNRKEIAHFIYEVIRKADALNTKDEDLLTQALKKLYEDVKNPDGVERIENV